MREIFTSGSVGGAPGNRCFYLEPDRLWRVVRGIRYKIELLPILVCFFFVVRRHVTEPLMIKEQIDG